MLSFPRRTVVALSALLLVGAAFPNAPTADALPSPARVATSLARGCGEGQQRVPFDAVADLPVVAISITDLGFVPAEVTIPAGTLVVWTNRGQTPHTTTAWNRWNSGILQPGEGCMAWFVTPGTYEYLSIVAADRGAINGSVTVTPNPSAAVSTR